MRFGVLQFPGSCDDVDALHAAARVGDAKLIWHAHSDLGGADAIIVPGGFSYGDYLRAGAIARFSRAMESVIAFARDGGLVLGICNGFQVLCEAHLLPGALLGNANLRFTSRQVQLDVLRADTAFTRACAADAYGDRSATDASGDRSATDAYGDRSATDAYGDRSATDASGDRSSPSGRAPGDGRTWSSRLSIPAKHAWGRYYADDRTLAAMDDAGQIVLRYAPGENFNGSRRDIAGVCNERGNVFGLMPHPEHAVDELVGGSSDGLAIFHSMRLSVEGAAT